MKTTDFDAKKKYTFVIPTGSTEQHGPFLPLGTDSYIQDEIIKAAEASFHEVVFLPTLRVTCSEEHLGFPGTLRITTSTMELVLREICESLQPYAELIIFVTAHGGNVKILNQFVEEYQKTFACVRLAYIGLDSEKSEQKIEALIHGPVDAHAGNTEISMLMAIDGNLVKVPPKDYPKTIIEHPFRTNNLKDFSHDGIADNHPEWVVDEALGEQFIQMAADEFGKNLRRIIKTK